MRQGMLWILAVLLLSALTACGAGTPASAPADQETSGSGVGNILLADGRVLPPADLTAVDPENPPVAVLAGVRGDGTAFALGLHSSGSTLLWAPEGSAGYDTAFTETVCTQLTPTTFAGDLDGGDNWAAVQARDRAGEEDAAQTYPAFHFVNTYPETYGLTGAYGEGWYLPSIGELYTIYQNRGAIERSLQAIHALDDQAAMVGLGTTWYWSSSQAGGEAGYVWFVHYLNGYAGACPKSLTNLHVLAVHGVDSML